MQSKPMYHVDWVQVVQPSFPHLRLQLFCLAGFCDIKPGNPRRYAGKDRGNTQEYRIYIYIYLHIFTYIYIPVEISTCSYKARGLAKKPTEWVGASKQNSIQNGKALCINQLFAAPPHFVGRYILPGCLIYFSEYESCLHAWTLTQKRYHFVRTCCSAISLHFSRLSDQGQPILLVR